MKKMITVFGFVCLTAICHADTCTVVSRTCLDSGIYETNCTPSANGRTCVFNGYAFEKACWEWKEEVVCSSGENIDHCTKLADESGCALEKEACLAMNTGSECTETQRTYGCDHAMTGLPDDNVALDVRISIDTSFDKNTACATLINDASCTEKSHVCTETTGTKEVDGVDVTLSCWVEQYTYSCETSPSSLTCAMLESAGCSLYKEVSKTSSTSVDQYACVTGKTTVPTHEDIVFIETLTVTDGYNTDDSACRTYEDNGTCSLTASQCVNSLTESICGTENRTYTCSGELDAGVCTVLDDRNCTASSESCNETLAGTCLTATKDYTCTGALPSPIASHIRETGREEVIDSITATTNCPVFTSTFALARRLGCTETGRLCTEGAATKVVDGEPVYKDCWHYEVTYECQGTGEPINGCEAWEANDTCELVNEECLASNGSECTYTTRTYRCKETADKVISQEKCTESVCAYGFCETRDDAPNTGLFNSVLKLEVARQAAVYGDYDDMANAFFKGELNTCENKQGQNCCAGKVKGNMSNEGGLSAAYVFGVDASIEAVKTIGSPYVYDVLSSHESLEPLLNKLYGTAANGAYSPSLSYYGITVTYTGGQMALSFNPYVFFAMVALEVANDYFSCEPEEQALQLKRGQNLCVYIGSFCSQYNMGSCLIKEERYCCYNSRLARIVQEAAHEQFNKGWGTIDNPDCGGISHAEFQMLDFSTIDLSEFLSDIAKQKLAEIDAERLAIQTGERIEELKNATDKYEPMDTKTGVRGM